MEYLPLLSHWYIAEHCEMVKALRRRMDRTVRSPRDPSEEC